jgi:peptidoglycan hydrolase-like protein with peptidoglycan-binding domain
MEVAMRNVINRLLLGLSGSALIACGPAEEDGAAVADQHVHESGMSALAPQGEVLCIGATGNEVRAVHRYLTEHGYLPNAALQRAYPQWRSPVSSAPAREDVYDERTAEAVRAFQRSFGLPDSGMIDDESRGIMVKARCGVPDMMELDESNKWDVDPWTWSSTNLTWRLMHTNGQCEVNAKPGCINQAQAESAIAAALGTWQGPSKHTFTKTTGAANIEIRFTPTRSNGTAWGLVVAEARLPHDGGDVYLDSAQYFSAATPPSAGTHDLQSILVHELGHSLGILHSSVSVAGAEPVMYPSVPDLGKPRRTLQPDDRVAAMLKGVSWQSFANTAIDIDVDDGPTWQRILVTALPAITGGYTVWSSFNGTWSKLPGQGAVRIGSNGSAPWIVQDDGDIYQWDRVTSSWTKRPGCAKDVAVGGDDSVWVIGCDAALGGYRVYKWNGSTFVADHMGGVRITVGPRRPGGAHVPWALMDDGHAIRRSSADISTGVWNYLPRVDPEISVTLGTDIAASPAGNVWMIGKVGHPGGFRIYAWNEQSAMESLQGDTAAQARAHWRAVQGGAVNVSVNSKGAPYVVDNANFAYYVQ